MGTSGRPGRTRSERRRRKTRRLAVRSVRPRPGQSAPQGGTAAARAPAGTAPGGDDRDDREPAGPPPGGRRGLPGLTWESSIWGQSGYDYAARLLLTGLTEAGVDVQIRALWSGENVRVAG